MLCAPLVSLHPYHLTRGISQEILDVANLQLINEDGDGVELVIFDLGIHREICT